MSPPAQRDAPIAGDERSRRIYPWFAVIATAALALPGVPLAPGLGMVFAMASDTCTGGLDAPICHASVQTLVFFLPIVAIVVGLLLCAHGVTLARRCRSPLRWLTAGWATVVLALVIAGTLATTGT